MFLTAILLLTYSGIITQKGFLHCGKSLMLWSLEGDLISVREVYNEIGSSEDSLAIWAKEQKKILFLESTTEELKFVGKIFQVRHFQAMIRKKERLKGKPVADPFVIARAKISGACVVTQEKNIKNAARIPNVCDHFGIHCINLEGFMEKENWTF